MKYWYMIKRMEEAARDGLTIGSPYSVALHMIVLADMLNDREISEADYVQHQVSLANHARQFSPAQVEQLDASAHIIITGNQYR